MYNALVRIFPVIHSIMSLTISNPRGEQIDIFPSPTEAASNNEHKNYNNGEGFYDEDDNPPFDGAIEMSASTSVLRDQCVDLTKRQRAVLEFFIAQIRLRSQRTMRHWAMIPPLANFSRGHLKHPYHPLHGSGCSVVTLWGYLNDLFQSAAKNWLRRI